MRSISFDVPNLVTEASFSITRRANAYRIVVPGSREREIYPIYLVRRFIATLWPMQVDGSQSDARNEGPLTECVAIKFAELQI